MTILQLARRLKWHFLERKPDLAQLQRKLGYFFVNRNVLLQSITHKSVDSAPRKNYERLEFLGDAIIDYVVSEKLISEFPQGDEGFLSQKRSALVRKSFLARMGNLLGILKYVVVKPSVDLTQDKVSQNQLANVFEALIGGMYVDGGIQPCTKLITETIWCHRREAWQRVNYKGLLIEFCHSNQLEAPEFLVANTRGPEHQKTFEVAVRIGDQTFRTGFGKDKKTAEQQAAQITLESLES